MLNLWGIISSGDTVNCTNVASWPATQHQATSWNRIKSRLVGYQRHGSLDAEGELWPKPGGRGWAGRRIVPLPRRMDNRSQCNRARPTPTGRLFVIGFTWRVVTALEWKCSGGKLFQSLPARRLFRHCPRLFVPGLPSPLSPYHNLSCQAASRWAPAVREVDTLN